MIGNAWPVGDTGYSVLEWGELDRQTLSLKVTAWIVADRRGEQQPGYHDSRDAAEQAALALAGAAGTGR
ncbi:MAG: hypothetical protein VW625_10215 [Perlucidibaca sp.]